MNDFERSARAKKIRRLVDAIAAVQHGFDGLIAESLRNWTPDDWAKFARGLGFKSPPSETTITAVVAIFDDRERRAVRHDHHGEHAEALPF